MLIELTPEEFKQAIEEYLGKHYNMQIEKFVFPDLTIEDYIIEGKPKEKDIVVEVEIDTDDDAIIQNDEYSELDGSYFIFRVMGPKDKVKDKLLDIFDHFEIQAETSSILDDDGKILKDHTQERQKYFEEQFQKLRNRIAQGQFEYEVNGNQTFRMTSWSPSQENTDLPIYYV
jgi:hypothetical protein